MEELSQLLEKLADRIMEERKRKQEDGASNDAVSAARSYMEEHYMDSSLSVEMLADIAGLSPAYFGKLFFTTVHVSCNDYLMELRLRKGARLRCGTQDTSVRSARLWESTARIILYCFQEKVRLYACPVSETDKRGAGKWKIKTESLYYRSRIYHGNTAHSGHQ